MDLAPFVCGGLAAMCAECGTFPIDTSKIRLQIQGQVMEASLKDVKYTGMASRSITLGWCFRPA